MLKLIHMARKSLSLVVVFMLTWGVTITPACARTIVAPLRGVSSPFGAAGTTGVIPSGEMSPLYVSGMELDVSHRGFFLLVAPSFSAEYAAAPAAVGALLNAPVLKTAVVLKAFAASSLIWDSKSEVRPQVPASRKKKALDGLMTAQYGISRAVSAGQILEGAGRLDELFVGRTPLPPALQGVPGESDFRWIIDVEGDRALLSLSDKGLVEVRLKAIQPGGRSRKMDASSDPERLQFRFEMRNGKGSCLDSNGVPGLNLGYVGICGDLKREVFSKTDLTGKDLRGSDMSGAYIPLSGKRRGGIDLKSSDVSWGKLKGAELSWLTDTKALYADLREIHMNYGNAVDADFRHADLREAMIEYSFMSGADFRNADLRGIRLAAVLHNARFERADLRGADLRGSSLSEAVFKGAEYDEDTHFPPGFDPKEAGMISVPSAESPLI